MLGVEFVFIFVVFLVVEETPPGANFSRSGVFVFQRVASPKCGVDAIAIGAELAGSRPSAAAAVTSEPCLTAAPAASRSTASSVRPMILTAAPRPARTTSAATWVRMIDSFGSFMLGFFLEIGPLIGQPKNSAGEIQND